MSFKERLGRAIMRADSQDLALIEELCKQRVELLEALKGMKDAFCNPESGEIDKRLAVQDMNKVITKAEAAE